MLSASTRSKGTVAGQACDTCRRRKSRCNEVRPKCSVCERLGAECVYRDSSSEDNSAQILETLLRLEGKIDGISAVQSPTGHNSASAAPSSLSRRTPSSNAASEVNDDATFKVLPRSFDTGKSPPPYFTAPHRTVIWPAIYTHIERFVPQSASQLAQLSEGGTSWLLSQEMTQFAARLPADLDLPFSVVEPGLRGTSLPGGVRFNGLTSERVSYYLDAYFNTFNVIYPILDEALVHAEMLPTIASDGFRFGDNNSVVVLFALALGQLATEAWTGPPTSLVDGIPSGICGGTAERPPGLSLFNEGRARIGTLVLRGDASSVQVLLLQGSYFEANACHVEYWRSIMEASLICQVLVQDPNRSWSTLAGDLLRRAFWACVMDEEFYHLDLNLPRTNIGDLVDQIRLPKFSEPFWTAVGTATDRPHGPLAFYFLAKVSLQRIISRIHQAVQMYSNRSEQLQDYVGPPIYVVKELQRQLEGWRTQLPQPLRWSDDDLDMAFESISVTNQLPKPTVDLLAENVCAHLSAAGVEILAVELRARFYYAQFILGRPFIFKALHFPETMKTDDTVFSAVALRAGCLLPLAMAPANQKKRLLPHLFTWTQNFIALLSILWIAQSNECLGRILAESLTSQQVEHGIQEMLHWIKDVKQIDGIAEWSWHFLQPLFAGAGGDISSVATPSE